MKEEELSFSVDIKENNVCMQISFFERLKSVRNDCWLSLHSPMVSLKKKSESLIKYYIKVTWARKLQRKTETYESAKCVPCNTRKCTHNGFVSVSVNPYPDLLKWALECRFYATGSRRLYSNLEHLSQNSVLNKLTTKRMKWLVSKEMWCYVYERVKTQKRGWLIRV